MDQNSRHSILVVDDVAANVRLLVEILRNTYRVVVATDGTAAIQRIQEQRPDLILLDVMMPGMNGFEVCERLKMSEDTASIPVIFVTARREMVDEERGFDLGAVDYITKPVRAAIVLARVRAQLELADQARHLEHLVAQRTREIQEALGLAEREKESRSAFLANMTHELRTPMNGVLGCLGAMEQFSLDPDVDQLVRVGKESGLRLADMLNRLLSLSALDARQWRPETISFAPRTEIANLERVFGQAARNKGLDFFCFVGPGVPEQVVGCRDALVHALSIVLLNAVQYTEHGAITCRIECDDRFPFLLPEMALIYVTVSDTGPGIEAEMQDRIFDPFEIGEPFLTKKRSGAGIGLAVAKRIVKESRGQIWVESEVGTGSNFTVTLPVELSDGTLLRPEIFPLEAPRTGET